jgi:hypothetical protein
VRHRKKFSIGKGVVMSGFAMKTAGVFLLLLKPSRYKGAHSARGGVPEGKRKRHRHGARSRETIELLKLIKSLR